MRHLGILLVLSIELFSCNNKVEISTLSTPQLITLRSEKNINFSKDTIEDHIYFLVLNSEVRNLFFLFDSVDYKSRKIALKCMQQEYTSLLEKKLKKNSFDICIRNKDTVFIDNMFSYTQSYSFLLYHNHMIDDVDHSKVASFDTISDWNLVEPTIKKVYVEMDLNTNSDIKKVEMKMLLNSVDTIIDVYSKVRDTLSYKTFGKDFFNLDFNEKVSVVRKRPLLIIFDFYQCECNGYFEPFNVDF